MSEENCTEYLFTEKNQIKYMGYRVHTILKMVQSEIHTIFFE